jgi:hypothetical protein
MYGGLSPSPLGLSVGPAVLNDTWTTQLGANGVPQWYRLDVTADAPQVGGMALHLLLWAARFLTPQHRMRPSVRVHLLCFRQIVGGTHL